MQLITKIKDKVMQLGCRVVTYAMNLIKKFDWAKTYVLDTSVNNVFFKGQQMIPKAYYDVLGMDED